MTVGAALASYRAAAASVVLVSSAALLMLSLYQLKNPMLNSLADASTWSAGLQSSNAYDIRNRSQGSEVEWDSNAQVVHIAQSGQTFNRADQYSLNSPVWSNNQFTWNGRKKKKSTVTMVGTAKPDKWFSYTESVFEGDSVNKTYEMFSVCSITSQPPKKEAGLVVVVPKAGQVSPAEADATQSIPSDFVD
jgi:hypothetical protein